jgi:hypothetical protein
VREIEIRPPLAARVFVVLFAGGFVLYIGIYFVVAAVRGQDVGGAPAGIGIAVFAAAVGYRMAALSFRARGQELVIHNYRRTRHIPASEVEGVDIGHGSRRSLQTVRILTSAGAIPVDVLSVAERISRRRAARDMEKLDRRRRELADWLAAARSLSDMAGPGETSGIC